MAAEESWKARSRSRHRSPDPQERIVKRSQKYLMGDALLNSNHAYDPDIQEEQRKLQIPSCGFAILAREREREKVHVWTGRFFKINKHP